MLCTFVTVSVIVWVCFNVSSPDQTVCIEVVRKEILHLRKCIGAPL